MVRIKLENIIGNISVVTLGNGKDSFTVKFISAISDDMFINMILSIIVYNNDNGEFNPILEDFRFNGIHFVYNGIHVDYRKIICIKKLDKNVYQLERVEENDNWDKILYTH